MQSIILGWASGIFWLQQQASLPTWQWLAFGAPLMMAALWGNFWLKRRNRLPVLRIAFKWTAGVFLGICWASLMAQQAMQQALPEAYENQDLVLVGTIHNLPYRFERGVRFQFETEAAFEAGKAVSGIPQKIILSWYDSKAQKHPELIPGQRWQVQVRLKRPHTLYNPQHFDYEVWMLERGLHATGYVRTTGDLAAENRLLTEFVVSPINIINAVRFHLRARIDSLLENKAYAGVIVALVIGDQRAMDQSDWQLFNKTGISHLVSISGLHITLVSGMFAWLFGALWRRSFFTRRQWPLHLPTRKAAALAGMSMACIYAALAGFGIPAQRALYMLLVVALALFSNRFLSVSGILLLALGIVLFMDPWAVLAPGFWLSFGAVGIILYCTLGRMRVIDSAHSRWRRWGQGFWAAARLQLAITIGLTPFTLLFFGQMTLVSPIANALAIPLLSFVVIPLSLLGSILPDMLAAYVWTAAEWCMSWLADILQVLEKLPYAQWEVPTPEPWMFLFAMLGTLWLLAPRGWPHRWVGAFCWLPLFLQGSAAPPSGEAWVTFFDIGQGSAVLVETRQHRLLFDAGPRYAPEADGANRVILPYFKGKQIRELDMLVISHADEDHAGGMRSLLEHLPVHELRSSLPDDHPALALSTRHLRCEAGQRWTWDGIDFEMMHPLKALDEKPQTRRNNNAFSCVLKVTRGEHAVLLTGDIGIREEKALLEMQGDKVAATVLLAPHHGSKTSSSEAFIQAVKPEYVLFQSAYLNRYKHPDEAVYNRYGLYGVKRVTTHFSGAVRFRLGETLEMDSWRMHRARYWHAGKPFRNHE